MMSNQTQKMIWPIKIINCFSQLTIFKKQMKNKKSKVILFTISKIELASL